MTLEPGHFILALTILAFAVPAVRLTPATGRAMFPVAAPAVPYLAAFEPTRPVVQIARLDAIVMASVEMARHAERLHHHAHEQVDAADYALQGLKNELAAISGVFAVTSTPRRAVPVRGVAGFPSALAA